MKFQRVVRVGAMWLAILLLASSVSWAESVTRRVHSDAASVVIVVKGKDRVYYLAAKDKPCLAAVKGPGKVAVVTRLLLPVAGTAVRPYALEVREGTTILKQYQTQTSASATKLKSGKGVPGKSRKFTVDLSAGMHNLEFRLLPPNGDPVALRIHTASKKGLAKPVTLEPLVYDRIVTAMVSEKLVTYYLATKEKGVVIRVVGPTTLQVTSRLNFETGMKGRQAYCVTVAEGKRVRIKKNLATTKSMTAAYQELKTVVAGKPQAFVVKVPGGDHTYVLSFDQTPAKTVAFKLAIPRADLDHTQGADQSNGEGE